MENGKENQKIDEFGNITFGEASRLLVGIIGQNAILDLVPKKGKNAYERNLQRMYNGEVPYSGLATTERGSPQWYFAQFFEGAEGIEKKYGIPKFAMNTIDSFTWQFFNALTLTPPFEIPKKEIAYNLARRQLLNFIDKQLLRGDICTGVDTSKVSGGSIIKFLTDSYEHIFSDIDTNFKRNKQSFYEKTSDDLDEEYKKNITNWRNENVYNPNWQTLVPVLDFLHKKDKTPFVHRLIGLYLRKNAQSAIKENLHISETAQEKIITDIVTMIMGKSQPEKFYIEVYSEDFQKDCWEQSILIPMALAYQNFYTKYDPVKFQSILEAIKDKCKHSKIFFKPWLKSRAIIFENFDSLKTHKGKQKKIIQQYREAYDKGVAYAGEYLGQFLLEAIIINNAFYPRQVKAANDYHGYGYALEIFGSDKKALLDLLKEVKDTDLREDIVNLHFNIRLKKFGLKTLSFDAIHNKAILINDQGLEFGKLNSPIGDLSAIEAFLKAIEMNPIYVNAYSNRGNVFNKIGEQFIEKALIDFNMALLLDPSHENTLYNRGMLFLKSSQFDKAIVDFSKLIELKPNDHDAYFNLGICYFGMDNFALALKNYNTAIEINSRFGEAYLNRSNCHVKMKNYNHALEDCNKAIEINPCFAEAYFNQGNCYAIINKFALALESYNTAIEIAPSFAEAYMARGLVYKCLGDEDKANNDFAIVDKIARNFV
ncbi:MAG: tetratricopeptide repeat protein [Spirochaetes bacterium]|nr:tetratricopeptide repeat protein [Spirochaetota bacterium]